MTKKGKEEVLTGQTLAGRYALESMLGHGGMGQVYLAHDTANDNRVVAVKTLRDQETTEWFKREFETVSYMVHPHIARVFDFAYDRERDLHLYTSEYVEGTPAHEALEGRSFERKITCYVQILRALQYIHGQGYLHCDVKPQNVLVQIGEEERQPFARVLDFGLSMSIPQSAMTARGTYYYMAPEWFQAGVPGAYTDIYSTGIMFYEMTYGVLPFEATSRRACVDFHTRGEMTFPDDSDVPEWWRKVLVRMTTKEIADRFQSVRDCIAAINRLGRLELPLHESGAGVESGAGGPWLGRQELLQQALGLIHLVEQGNFDRGCILVVEGVAGAGKSRLLAELKRRAQLEGRTVVGLTPSSAAGTTFGALSSVVDGLTGEASRLPQERVSHVVSGLVSRLVSFAAHRQVVFLVDDVGDLDEHSLSFLQGVVNTIEYALANDETPPRVAIIATSSSAEADPGPLAAHGLANTDSLPLFTREEAERFIRLVAGLSSSPPQLTEEALAACEGNPKLLLEFTLFVKNAGCLAVSPTGVTFDRDKLPRGGLPGDIEQYLASAWGNFGELERKLLTAMALLFTPQPFPILAEVTGLEVWQIDQLVFELAERGLVTFRAFGDRTLPAVESEMHRQLYTSSLGKADARSIHKRIATALESSPRLAASQPETLAFHCFYAGRRKHSLRYALKGAQSELSACNFQRALELAHIARKGGAGTADLATLYFEIYKRWGKFDDGVAQLQGLSGGADGGESEQVGVYQAELHFRSGAFDSACELLEPLLENEDNPLRGQVLALLARVFFNRGKLDDSRRTGETGMLRLPQDSREFAMCTAMVGLVRVYQGRLRQGVKYLETALGVLTSNGSPSDLAFVQNSTGLAYHKLKDYAQALEHYQKSLEIATSAGDHERINISAMNLSVVFQETGEFSMAISRYKEALAMAYQAQNLPVLARVYNNLGNIHRYLGMLEKAREFTEQSLELSDRLGLDQMRGLNRMLLGEILTYQGRWHEASEMFDRAQALFEEQSAAEELIECDIDRVELLGAMDELDRAAELGQKSAEESRRYKLDNHRVRAILATAGCLIRRGVDDDSAAAGELLKEAAELITDEGNPELEWKLWSHLTYTHTSGGEPEQAETTLRRAEAALAEVRRKVPQEFQSVFFKRADRERDMMEFAKLTSRMTQLAKTIQPGGLHEAGLLKKQRWMSQLIQMNKRLLAQPDLEKLLETLIDVVVDLSGAERGFVILRARAGLDVVVARNMDREVIRRSRSKFSTSIAYEVLETGETVRLEDAIEAPDFREKESVMALRIRSVICLPIIGRSETIAAMYIDNRFKPGVFNESVVEMLKAFAEQAALAIENAGLLQKYRTTVEELGGYRKEVDRLNRQLEEKVRFQEALLVQKTEEISRQREQLEDRYQFASIVGRSRALSELFTLMERVKEAHVPVLVTGESGVGKELVARALHFNGPRKAARFVSINCAALPDTLLEAELFGYVKGAFTDAAEERKGLFSQADGGTLFLDEVGDMSLAMQSKLLRVLQEGEFAPLGSEQIMTVDVRIVAATNRDLKQMASTGEFRQDLYYRLDVVTVLVPPLRERKDDIPLLTEHFLDLFAEKNKIPRPTLSMEAARVLMSYDWPGNVRELQSVVMTAAVFAERGAITLTSLQSKPEVFSESPGGARPLAGFETLELKALERQAIIAALRRSGGNKQQAARILGISRRALYNKLEAYRINTKAIKD